MNELGGGDGRETGGVTEAAPAGAGSRQRISPESAYRALRRHPLWVVERDRIYRDMRFPSFRAAISFVDRVAEIAERHGHHPNICVHEWCFVHLELYSHIGGNLTTKDVELAIAIDDEADAQGGGDG
jgi:4a-hydroxytetrahydrobiopterin dehydratase